MALTKVTSGVRTLGTGEVTSANLASDAVPGVTSNQDDIALLGFKVAANGSLAKYNLVDQTIDAFEDTSGVDASASTNEVRDSSGKYYSGEATVTPTVTGGTITTYGDYTIHTFLTGDDYVTNATQSVDVLVVAGGGAGGGGHDGGNGAGGAGGAGGMIASSAYSLAADTYTIAVGAGATAGDGIQTRGPSGDNSQVGSISALEAIGGGGGASGGSPSPNPNSAGLTGGSGGGSSRGGTIGSGTVSQGNAGGLGVASGGGGAGGGAGAVGGGASGNTGGTGGVGVANSYRTDSGVTYAAGANGGPSSAGTVNAPDATANTGNGGGGGSDSEGLGGNGGSGIVVIKRLTSDVGPAAMTLISNATTAESAPTTGDLVITYTDGAGTATVNTDIKAYISRNGSAYTSAVTLASQGTTGGHTILTANGVDLSGITTGTSMRWKIETLNQSATKETRIQAVSLGWS
jgi:hypothetical protein